MRTQCLLFFLAVVLPNAAALKLKEFRIPMPFTPDQLKFGHRWSAGQFSLDNTGGGEGVEIVVNEPRQLGDYPIQYTHKIFHLATKVPKIIRSLAPKGSLETHEYSWNSFPEVTTVVSNPDYMKDGFHVTITSVYMENDDCTQDNIFNLPDTKSAREIVNIDIVNDPLPTSDYSDDTDPKKCRSEKLNLGPLTSDWKTEKPHMCIYKLVEVEFKWFGLQERVESRLQKTYYRLFLLFHRKMFCWADQWAGMTEDEILDFEENLKVLLDERRNTGEVIGMREQ